MVEEGRADEEAFLVALEREAAAVDDQLRALVDAHLDVVLDARLVRGADHRAVMGLGVGRDADAQPLDRGNQFLAQSVGGVVAHRHHDGQRHAALAGRAEGRAGKVVDDLVEVGVGHDDAVVLGPAERLDALPVRGAARVDVVGDVGRADEADRRDVRMVEDRVDHLLVAVDDVEDSVGQPGFLHQLGEAHRHGRVALAGLQDERIAAGDRHAEHPHRDHRGEVERRDAGADAERLAHRIDVDAGTGADGIFALQRLRDAAAIFDHLEPALDVALGVGDDLAVLRAEQMRELVHVGFDQLLILEHDAGAALRIGRRPGGLRGLRGIDRFLEVGGRAEADMGLDLALVGVEHLALPLAAGKAGTADEMVDAAKHGYASSLVLRGWRATRPALEQMPVVRTLEERCNASTGRAFVSAARCRRTADARREAARDRRAGQRRADEGDRREAGQLRHAAHALVADRPQARDRRGARMGPRANSSGTRRLAAIA